MTQSLVSLRNWISGVTMHVRRQVIDEFNEVFEGFSSSELDVILFRRRTASKLSCHFAECVVDVLFVYVQGLGQ
jgi:hypothetical protein